jgi:hypothetical protein
MLDRPLAALDAWIAKQKEPELSRPEAIRRLVEIGLAAGPSVMKTARRAPDDSVKAAADRAMTSGAANRRRRP